MLLLCWHSNAAIHSIVVQGGGGGLGAVSPTLFFSSGHLRFGQNHMIWAQIFEENSGN